MKKIKPVEYRFCHCIRPTLSMEKKREVSFITVCRKCGGIVKLHKKRETSFDDLFQVCFSMASWIEAYGSDAMIRHKGELARKNVGFHYERQIINALVAYKPTIEQLLEEEIWKGRPTALSKMRIQTQLRRIKIEEV